MNSNTPKGSSESDRHKASKRFTKEKAIFIFLVILLVVSISTTIFYYHKYQTIKNNPSGVVEAETQELVDTVSKLIELPADEQPTIATVEDNNKLKDQPFFSSTENGDKILIYTNAKQAIIYRPSSNRIINVGPIVISTDIESGE